MSAQNVLIKSQDKRNWSVEILQTAVAYIRAECNEILSESNRRLTAIWTGNPNPTRAQCFDRWMKSGDLDRFRETHKIVGV